MNCEEVKNYLTEYLDKTLDVATTTRVATHIISCPPCRAEANELSGCVQQIAALPLIDPPLGFAQRVMAHVREIEPEPSIWQRWFLPFRIKVSLQAAAVVLVAVMVGFLYQKEDRLKVPVGREIATVPNSTTPAASADESTAGNSLAVQKHASSAERQAPAIAKLVETVPLHKGKTLSSNEQIQTAKAEKLDIEPRQEENRAIKRSPIPVQEVSNPRDSGRLSADPFAFDFGAPSAVFRQPARRLESTNIERSIAPLFDRSADIEFVVRRHAPQRRDQAEGLSTATLRKSADADAAPTNSAVGINPGSPAAAKIESIAEIRYYNVAPEHFDAFKKDLAQESVIETESKLSLREKEMIAQSARPLLIKVTILPSASAESSAAPR